MKDALVGLGANLGDRSTTLLTAVRALDELPSTEVADVSHIFESEPWGVQDQPVFMNAVVRMRTRLRPDQLLGYLKDAEEDLGRTVGVRYGPRVIDLDLLLMEDEEWHTEELILPHPRMAERDFVITPLLQIAPDVTWPSGARIGRGKAKLGRVTADLGQLPGAEDRWYDWELRESEPIGCPVSGGHDVDWVEVGSGWGVGLDVEIKLAKLRDVGIPAELDQRPFADKIGLPLGGFEPSRIFVPRSMSGEARAALGSPVQSPMPRLEDERRGRPFWFRVALVLALIAWAGPWLVRAIAEFVDTVAGILS